MQLILSADPVSGSHTEMGGMVVNALTTATVPTALGALTGAALLGEGISGENAIYGSLISAGSVAAAYFMSQLWKFWDKRGERQEKARTNRIEDEANSIAQYQNLLIRVDQDRKDAVREREDTRKQMEQERAEMEERCEKEMAGLRRSIEQCKLRTVRLETRMEYLEGLLTDRDIKFRPWVEPTLDRPSSEVSPII